MQEFSNIYNTSRESIDSLLENHLTVTEKLSGSSFAVQSKEGSLKFYKGSKEIDIIDRTLMSYYEDAISHIENTVKDLDESLRFCFQYFVNHKPGIVKYDRLPKNKLVLTHILEMSKTDKVENIISNFKDIKHWSNKFNVSSIKPIFEGYLTDKQKTKLKEYLSLSFEFKEEIFKSSSFSSHIFNILNSELKSTMLQENLNKSVDSFVFSFSTGINESYKTKILDPYTVQSIKKGKEPHLKFKADINEIILLDVLSFIEERGIYVNDLIEKNPKERYIELISNIYNDYVLKHEGDIKNIEIDEADFAKGHQFKVNLNLIKNQKTKENIKSSPTHEKLFKIMLGSLRKKRNEEKPGNVMTKAVIIEFNQLVDKVNDIINKKTDNKFKTFKDFISESIITESLLEEDIIEENKLKINEFLDLGKIKF